MTDTLVQPPRPAELAAMLAAKLCHDLISPTSAIVSGVDLLEDPESQDLREDALDLIIASSRKLGALLQFCRVAFGASASADTFDSRDLKSLADGVFANQKSDLEWAVPLESVNKSSARALLNMAQLGGAVLPRGGTTRIEARLDGDLVRLTMIAEGPRARLRPEVAEGLGGLGMSEGLGGHWVQAYYLYLIVTDASGRLEHTIEEEKVTILATLPA